MKVAILQSNYIPWKGYFHLINDVDIFVFYDEVQYTKNDWRNRNKIYTKNGVHWLSIPIYRNAVKQKISEVELKDKKWQELHYKSLYLGYKKSPYFFQLKKILKEVYIDKQWDSLSDLNQFLIKYISSLIGIKTKFKNSKTYSFEGDRVEHLITLLKQLNATEYISGPSAKGYITKKIDLFNDNNIILTYKGYPEYPEYNQLGKPFRNDVSILDLIANIKLDDISKYIWGF